LFSNPRKGETEGPFPQVEGAYLRWAILVLVPFYFVSAVILCFVDLEKGEKQVESTRTLEAQGSRQPPALTRMITSRV
jgi:hypothetical protein